MFGDLTIIDWFLMLVRWIHAVSAVAWIGGSIFFAFVLRPVSVANPGVMRPVMGSIGNVYRELVDASIIAIVVSGVIMMFSRLTGDDASVAWFIVLGVKLVIAFWMFYMVWRFRQTSFQSAGGTGIFSRLSWLLGYNALVAFGVIVFFLATLLRELFEAGIR